MSMSLADALEEVELEAGHTYCCEVRGRRVELRVHEDQHQPESSGLHPDDIMLDAWCELPSPPTIAVSQSRLIDCLPFDIPVIPTDEDLA